MAPLVCQSLIAKGVPWFHFYYGSIVLSAINLGILGLAFFPTHTELQEEQLSNGNKVHSSSAIPSPQDEKSQTDLEKDIVLLTDHDPSIAESNDSTCSSSFCKSLHVLQLYQTNALLLSPKGYSDNTHHLGFLHFRFHLFRKVSIQH